MTTERQSGYSEQDQQEAVKPMTPETLAEVLKEVANRSGNIFGYDSSLQTKLLNPDNQTNLFEKNRAFPARIRELVLKQMRDSIATMASSNPEERQQALQAAQEALNEFFRRTTEMPKAEASDTPEQVVDKRIDLCKSVFLRNSDIDTAKLGLSQALLDTIAVKLATMEGPLGQKVKTAAEVESAVVDFYMSRNDLGLDRSNPNGSAIEREALKRLIIRYFIEAAKAGLYKGPEAPELESVPEYAEKAPERPGARKNLLARAREVFRKGWTSTKEFFNSFKKRFRRPEVTPEPMVVGSGEVGENAEPVLEQESGEPQPTLGNLLERTRGILRENKRRKELLVILNKGRDAGNKAGLDGYGFIVKDRSQLENDQAAVQEQLDLGDAANFDQISTINIGALLIEGRFAGDDAVRLLKVIADKNDTITVDGQVHDAAKLIAEYMALQDNAKVSIPRRIWREVAKTASYYWDKVKSFGRGLQEKLKSRRKGKEKTGTNAGIPESQIERHTLLESVIDLYIDHMGGELPEEEWNKLYDVAESNPAELTKFSTVKLVYFLFDSTVYPQNVEAAVVAELRKRAAAGDAEAFVMVDRDSVALADVMTEYREIDAKIVAAQDVAVQEVEGGDLTSSEEIHDVLSKMTVSLTKGEEDAFRNDSAVIFPFVDERKLITFAVLISTPDGAKAVIEELQSRADQGVKEAFVTISGNRWSLADVLRMHFGEEPINRPKKTATTERAAAPEKLGVKARLEAAIDKIVASREAARARREAARARREEIKQLKIDRDLAQRRLDVYLRRLDLRSADDTEGRQAIQRQIDALRAELDALNRKIDEDRKPGRIARTVEEVRGRSDQVRKVQEARRDYHSRAAQLQEQRFAYSDRPRLRTARQMLESSDASQLGHGDALSLLLHDTKLSDAQRQGLRQNVRQYTEAHPEEVVLTSDDSEVPLHRYVEDTLERRGEAERSVMDILRGPDRQRDMTALVSEEIDNNPNLSRTKKRFLMAVIGVLTSRVMKQLGVDSDLQYGMAGTSSGVWLAVKAAIPGFAADMRSAGERKYADPQTMWQKISNALRDVVGKTGELFDKVYSDEVSAFLAGFGLDTIFGGIADAAVHRIGNELRPDQGVFRGISNVDLGRGDKHSSEPVLRDPWDRTPDFVRDPWDRDQPIRPFDDGPVQRAGDQEPVGRPTVPERPSDDLDVLRGGMPESQSSFDIDKTGWKTHTTQYGDTLTDVVHREYFPSSTYGMRLDEAGKLYEDNELLTQIFMGNVEEFANAYASTQGDVSEAKNFVYDLARELQNLGGADQTPLTAEDLRINGLLDDFWKVTSRLPEQFDIPPTGVYN